MTTVSMRELKNNLSDYVRRASEGEEIVVTNRGKAVATVRPLPAPIETLDQKLDRLAAIGLIRRGKGKFVPRTPRIKLRGEGPTVSEMVLQDRGDPIP